jgi:hypothetical protein
VVYVFQLSFPFALRWCYLFQHRHRRRLHQSILQSIQRTDCNSKDPELRKSSNGYDSVDLHCGSNLLCGIQLSQTYAAGRKQRSAEDVLPQALLLRLCFYHTLDHLTELELLYSVQSTFLGICYLEYLRAKFLKFQL